MHNDRPITASSSLLSHILLSIFHFAHFVTVVLKCCIPRVSSSGTRKQTPKHIALVLEPPATQSAGPKHQNATSTKNGDHSATRGLETSVVDDMVECVRRMVQWCSEVSVEELTLYDSQGLLKQHHARILDAVSPNGEVSTADAQPVNGTTTPQPESMFPMTPPPSDGDSSSSLSDLSPVISFRVEDRGSPLISSSTLRRRVVKTSPVSSLRVNLICRDQGKPALARAAQQISAKPATGSNSLQPTAGIELFADVPPTADTLPNVDVQGLNALLEHELSAPDLLIVHPLLYPHHSRYGVTSRIPPLELYGFPPWQIRLTEIFYDPLPPQRLFSFIVPSFLYSPSKGSPSSAVITQHEFARALDQFGRADMKLGK